MAATHLWHFERRIYYWIEIQKPTTVNHILNSDRLRIRACTILIYCCRAWYWWMLWSMGSLCRGTMCRCARYSFLRTQPRGLYMYKQDFYTNLQLKQMAIQTTHYWNKDPAMSKDGEGEEERGRERERSISPGVWGTLLFNSSSVIFCVHDK